MNEKNTDHLLKLIDDLIKLVGKNVDNINKLGEEVAELKAKRKQLKGLMMFGIVDNSQTKKCRGLC